MALRAAAAGCQNDESHKNMRELIQQRFLEEVIDSTGTWKVLVMDDHSTRIISSVLTMYDIMEHRVTIVENLSKLRRPFPEMDVVYFVVPTRHSIELIMNDFPNQRESKYGNVHLFFTDNVSGEAMSMLQMNPILISKIKTFKEIYIDFLCTEANVFHLDMPMTLSKLYGALPDPDYPYILGRKLATACISLNEHPAIRFQSSSPACREIATVLNQTLVQFRRSNPGFCPNGEDQGGDKDRGQLLIVDRTFDTVSPLMHEYTYQAMVMDLLDVQEGLISYTATTGKATEERQALLNESDALWGELRYSHIAKVIEIIKDRMNDIIQNSNVARRGGGAGNDMTITAMAAVVKELPEYQQAMSKLGQHVNIAQQCMNAFGRLGLLDLSKVEQTMSTGYDEDGNEVRGPKLMQLIIDTLRAPNVDRFVKLRIAAIFIASQRGATPDDRRQVITAARLSGPEQQILVNLDRIAMVNQSAQLSGRAESKTGGGGGGLLSSIFRRPAPKHAATPEGEYADTRHTTQLKILLDLFMGGELPSDKFPATGPAAAPTGGDAKSSVAKSVRKYGVNSRWGKKDQTQLSGGRYMVFVAGGVSYAELRSAYEAMQHNTKEVIVGSSHIVNPEGYLENIAEFAGSL